VQLLWAIGGGTTAILLTIALLRRPRADLSGCPPMTMRLEESFFMTSNGLARARSDWSCLRRVEESANHLFLYTDKTRAYVIPTSAFASTASQQAFYDFARRKVAAATEPPPGNQPRWPLSEPDLVAAGSAPDIIRIEATLTAEKLRQLDFHGVNPPQRSSTTSLLMQAAVFGAVWWAMFSFDGHSGRVLCCIIGGFASIALATYVYRGWKRRRWRADLDPHHLETHIITFSPRGVTRCSRTTETFADWGCYAKLAKNKQFFVLQPVEALIEARAIPTDAFDSSNEAAAFETLARQQIKTKNEARVPVESGEAAETGNPYQPPQQQP